MEIKSRTIWTESDLDILRKEYPRGDIADIAIRLGKTVSSIKSKVKALKIKRDKEALRIWNKERIDRLKEIYPDMLNMDVAKELGVTKSQVSNRAHRIGLKKSIAFRYKYSSKSFFEKGGISHNKGKKMSEFMNTEQIEKIKKTWYRKGNLPHNTKNDFDITERKDKSGRTYLYIRVSLDNWQALHRYVWEKKYGKIKKGVNIRFKDGNTMNCSIENLYAIDNRGNMLKNSGALNLPDGMVARYLSGKNGNKDEYINHPELLELKRNQIKLNRKIKEHERETANT